MIYHKIYNRGDIHVTRLSSRYLNCLEATNIGNEKTFFPSSAGKAREVAIHQKAISLAHVSMSTNEIFTSSISYQSQSRGSAQPGHCKLIQLCKPSIKIDKNQHVTTQIKSYAVYMYDINYTVILIVSFVFTPTQQNLQYGIRLLLAIYTYNLIGWQYLL